ncbi:hypothetical protein I3247_08955 [Psychrobacter sp. Ps5]|jgi:hypothetical protein|uniref:hypothetical protein n=1 Tax=Psychrobacter faecalis TaxID=180588 RepID=UPI0019195024|nr:MULTISPECIES: hypothetical protein [Psychrobacter]MCG3861709.1 hypothetical protein [Psychrobacter sp. Ps5]
MSDKKSNQSADLEANLAKIANAKPRRRSRKDNIYERFITRVENVDSSDNNTNREQANVNDGKLAPLKPLKNADKLSSYEPLSAAELELFASQQDELRQQKSSLQGTNATSTGVNLDFSDENESLGKSRVAIADINDSSNTEADDDYADEANNTIAREASSFSSTAPLNDANRISESYEKNESIDIKSLDIDDIATQSSTILIPAKDKKLASSKKPLIIGMIVGSLLIAAVVLTLIFTGFLSTNTSTEPALPINAGTPKSNNDSSGNKVATASNTAEASNQSTVDAQTSVPSTGNKDLDNKNTAKNTQGADGQSTAATTNNSENESASEPAITYEDFREESQSTLFRETND